MKAEVEYLKMRKLEVTPPLDPVLGRAWIAPKSYGEVAWDVSSPAAPRPRPMGEVDIRELRKRVSSFENTFPAENAHFEVSGWAREGPGYSYLAYEKGHSTGKGSSKGVPYGSFSQGVSSREFESFEKSPPGGGDFESARSERSEGGPPPPPRMYEGSRYVPQDQSWLFLKSRFSKARFLSCSFRDCCTFSRLLRVYRFL
jgi:hypothetical protein